MGALRALDHAQRKHPDDPEVWLVRAALHWKRGRLDSAAADLYDVLKNEPGNVDAHCLLAEVLAARKRISTAREHFEKALKIDPRCAWAAQGLRRLARAIEPLPPEKPSAALTALTADPAPTSSDDGP